LECLLIHHPRALLGGDGCLRLSVREDLAIFWPQRHLAGDTAVTLLPYGGGERVCLGKALAEPEIRLLAVGLPKQLTLALEADQDLTLKVIPSPAPADGLLVRPYSKAS
jgi:cytochrome P450